MSVVDLLAARAARGWDESATVLVGRRPAEAGGLGDPVGYSGAELGRAVKARAEVLGQAGAGAPVPVTLESDCNGVITLLALWHLGAVPAPLNPRLTVTEREEAESVLADVSAPEAQAVLWTSGTAGRARGVALSFRGLVASAEAASDRLGLSGPRDAWLASLSLAHVGGLALVVRALLLGSRLVALGRLSPAGISAAIDGASFPGHAHDPVTHLSLVPTQLLGVLDHRADRPPPPTLAAVLVGGAHAPRPLVDRALAAGWPLALTYGMTEMTSQVATAPPELVRRKPGTVGPALKGVEVRVASDGEVLVRGRTVAMGYIGDPTALLDDDGWLHTGDLGELDGEGDLWITGRRSDRVISGGVTVDALEVENSLRRHPAVVDACVVGLPDPRWGEIVAAGVVGVEGELDVSELDVWCRERMAPAKRPRRWMLFDSLPLNPNGKVDRSRVRAAWTHVQERSAR